MLSKDEAVKSLMQIFQKQSFPEQIALTIIRRREDDPLIKMPCQKYSLGNQLIMFFIGKTELCGTYKQWQAVGRQVRKGSKAFPLFAPLTKIIKETEGYTSRLPNFCFISRRIDRRRSTGKI